MIQHTQPVRANTPQPFLYTFRNQNGVVLDLTNYVSAYLELKVQGATLVLISVQFANPRTSGQVSFTAYTHAQTGTWNAQFYVVDGGGNKVYGEPVQYTVVPNIDDLAITQLLVY